MISERPYYSLNLLELGILPSSWQEDVFRVSRDHSIDTVLTGEGLTSRERNPGQKFRVRVVDGVLVKQELFWLWNLYEDQLRAFASAAFGKPLFTANLLHTTININQLSGRNAQYEWHVDSNPVTGVLFATDSEDGLGGSLVFRKPCGARYIVRPRAGTFVCFDAREIPHRVAPLRKDGIRVSLPMNYYESQTDQPRPSDLDAQIYTEGGGSGGPRG
jgi:2OG-Fe(II) oxygenase superfamily